MATMKSNKPKLVVDTHSHMYYPAFMEVLRQRSSIPKVVKHPESGEERLVILPNEERSSSVGRPCPPDFYSVAKKVEYMDQHGIDVSVVSLANPWLNFLAEDGIADSECLTMAKKLNADLDKMCAETNSQRGETTLLGFGVIPTVRNVNEAAVPTLQSFEQLPNLKGIIMGTTGIDGAGLDSEWMEPVYAELERQELVLFVHPHYGLKGENLTTDASGEKHDYGHALELALGFPFETSIAISKLILSGVLDRYPRLKVLVAHAGGALPWLHGRLDSCASYEREKEGTSIHRLKKFPPTEYLKDLYFDAIIYDSTNLTKLVELVGSDHITFGTDHPFFPPVKPNGEDGAAGYTKWESCTKVQQTILSQDSAVSDQIFGNTAAKLFGL